MPGGLYCTSNDRDIILVSCLFIENVPLFTFGNIFIKDQGWLVGAFSFWKREGEL